MSDKPSSSRISTYIAAFCAVAVAIIIPGGYFALNYENIHGKLDAEAEINARLVTHLIVENPELWRFENYRLDELLSRRPAKGGREIRRLTDMDGNEFARSGQELPSPVISHVETIRDAGRPVAKLYIHTTLEPLLARTGILAVFGAIAGGILFMTLHLVPLRKAKRAEKALKDSSDFLTRVMDNNTSGLVVLDSQDRITFCNKRFARMCGEQEGVLAGIPFVSTFVGAADQEHLHTIFTSLRDMTEPTAEFETTIARRDGTSRHLLCGIARVRDDAADSELVISAEDITHRRESEERIRQMAYFDSLTTLPNRALFNNEITRTISASQRTENVFGLLVLDVDNFKRINDTLGHHYGDLLLQQVADRLVECVRKSDYLSRSSEETAPEMVARLGGDEFTILLTSFNHDEDAAKVAKRIIDRMAAPFQLDERELYTTVSIGIATYPADGEDRETLFKNADTAMYHAKSAGKNTYKFYRSAMNDSAMKRLNLENHLFKALENNEFELYYQPRVDVKSGSIHSAEALIRWHHPELGMVPPGEFIAIAEENGLIMPITEWVLQEACRQNAAWQNTGLPAVKVSINISSNFFKQRNLPELLGNAFAATGLRPELLEVEITESLMLHNVAATIKTLTAIRDMGVTISIDDFGTGYSSFSYLTQLPVNTIKIDRSFVMELPQQERDCAIVKAIIATSHSLGLAVVAEGVETDGQCRFLAANGCNEFQGYLFSRPVPAPRFAELLRQNDFAELVAADRSTV